MFGNKGTAREARLKLTMDYKDFETAMRKVMAEQGVFYKATQRYNEVNRKTLKKTYDEWVAGHAAATRAIEQREKTHLRALRENASYDKRRQAEQEREGLRAFDREAKRIEKLMRERMTAEERAQRYVLQVRRNSQSLELAQERQHLSRMNAQVKAALREQNQIRVAEARWANERRDLTGRYDAGQLQARQANARRVSWDQRSGTFVPQQIGGNEYQTRSLAQRMGMSGMGGYIGLGPLGGVGIMGPLGAAASVGSAGIRGAYNKGQEGLESDYAIKRMMTLVSKSEQGGYGLSQGTAEAQSLARELGITIPQAANAMREALTNAVPPESIRSFAKAANSLAILEDADLTSTIRALSSIRNAFDMDWREMETVPDVIFAALDEGNLKLTEMADQIGQLSGVAKQAGVSFREMMGALGAVTLKGVHGDPAAVGLRFIMSNISNPTAEAVKTQEKIGVRLTPALVQARGLKGALQEVKAAADASGVSIEKALGGGIRSAKILHYLTEKGGADFQEALNAQERAIEGKRAQGANADLMGTALKRQARVGESFSQIGQRIGKPLAELPTDIGSGLLGLGDWVSDTHAYRTAAGLVGGLTVGKGLTASGPIASKSQQEWVQRWGTMQAQNRRRRAGQMDPEQARGIAERDAQDAATLDGRLAASMQVWRDLRVGQAHTMGGEFDENYKRLRPKHTALASAASSAMGQAESSRTYWNDRSGVLSRLGAGLSGDAQDRRSAFEGGLSGAGAVDSIFGIIERTKRFNGLATAATDPEEEARLRGEASSAFGAIKGFDLSSIAKTGFNSNDVESMIERRVGARGLRGYAATEFRRGQRGEARQLEKTIGSAYTEFQKTNLPDSDFSAWYAERGQGQIMGSAESVVGAAQKSAESKYSAATAAYREFRTLSEEIAKNWNAVETSAVIIKELLDSVNPEDAESVDRVLGEVKARTQAAAGQTKSLTGLEAQKARLDKRVSGFKYKTDRMESDVAPGFVAPMVAPSATINDNRTVEVKMEVTVPAGTDPKTIAKLVQDGLVVKIREELDRGRSTLQNSK